MARPSVNGAPAGSEESYRLASDDLCLTSVLANDLTVIARPHTAAPLAAVRIYVRTGSALEAEYAGSGISHLLEHVATGDAAGWRTEREILTLCDALGGLVNAYTSDDHICYHAVTARERFATAVGLLADWAVRPAMTEAVFRRERGVVLRELERDRDDPQTQLEELLAAAVYRGHPLQYPIIGHREAIERLTLKDLVGYHARTHVPGNIVVVVVGDVEPDFALAAVRSAFAGVARRPPAIASLPEPTPVQCPRQFVKTMEAASASMALAWQTVRETAEDDVALDILSSVLTEGDTARLVRSLRWDRSLVHELSGTHESMWHTIGTFDISAELEPQQIGAVERAITDEIERLQAGSIEQAELERARQQAILPLEQQRQTAEGLAAQLGEDFLATGSLDYTDAYISRVRRTTVDDLHRVVRRYLRPERRTLAAVVPADRGKRSRQAIRKAPLAVVERHVLSNGLTCLIRPMTTSAFASVFVTFAGGLSAETPDTNGVHNLLAEAMPRGTANRTAEEIAEFFESRGASLRAAGGAEAVSLACTVRGEDCERALEVLGDVVGRPLFDVEQVDKLRPAICDAIARVDDHWHSELTRFARRHFFLHSPYRMSALGAAEVIERLRPADLRSHHARCVLGARGVVSVAGAIDPERVREACERTFESIARGERATHVEICPEPEAAADRLFVKPAGSGREVAGVFVGFPAPPIIDRRAVAAMAVFGAMVTGYTLSSGRLFAALRAGDQDLVYEVTGAILCGTLPGYFAVTAACGPDRVCEVAAIIRREVDAIRAGHSDEAELDRARAMVITGELDQLQTPDQFARRCGADELLGLGHDYCTAFLEDVRAVSHDDVVQFGGRFLRRATIAVVTPDPRAVELGIEAVTVAGSRGSR